MSKTNGERQLEYLQNEADVYDDVWSRDGWAEWGDEIKNEVLGTWNDDIGDCPMNSWSKGKYDDIYDVKGEGD